MKNGQYNNGKTREKMIINLLLQQKMRVNIDSDENHLGLLLILSVASRVG